jgi:hypothetical protein
MCPRACRGIGAGRMPFHARPTIFDSGKSPELPEAKVYRKVELLPKAKSSDRVCRRRSRTCQSHDALHVRHTPGAPPGAQREPWKTTPGIDGVVCDPPRGAWSCYTRGSVTEAGTPQGGTLSAPRARCPACSGTALRRSSKAGQPIETIRANGAQQRDQSHALCGGRRGHRPCVGGARNARPSQARHVAGQPRAAPE